MFWSDSVWNLCPVCPTWPHFLLKFFPATIITNRISSWTFSIWAPLFWQLLLLILQLKLQRSPPLQGFLSFLTSSILSFSLFLSHFCLWKCFSAGFCSDSCLVSNTSASWHHLYVSLFLSILVLVTGNVESCLAEAQQLSDRLSSCHWSSLLHLHSDHLLHGSIVFTVASKSIWILHIKNVLNVIALQKKNQSELFSECSPLL